MKRMTWYWMLGGFLLLAFVMLIRLPSLVSGQLEVSQTAGAGPLKGVARFLMQRDLKKYFADGGVPVTRVDYELLGESEERGAGGPAYFIWTIGYTGQSAVKTGAARVQAVRGTGFEVTRFFDRSEILLGPGHLSEFFPPPLIPVISARAAGKMP
jgi:hypothetical protein